jgi:hypothetical protein
MIITQCDLADRRKPGGLSGKRQPQLLYPQHVFCQSSFKPCRDLLAALDAGLSEHGSSKGCFKLRARISHAAGDV